MVVKQPDRNPDKATPSQKRGPKEERVAIDGDWERAVERALKKPPPPKKPSKPRPKPKKK